MSWVAAVVRVMPHSICGFAIRSVSIENGSGGSSPGCISSAGPVDGAAVEPRRRAGLEPAEREARARSSVARQPDRRRLADPAGRDLLLADMDQAAQEGAGGQHHGAGAEARGHRPAGRRRPGRPRSSRSSASPSITVRFGVSRGSPPAWRPHRACGRPGRAGRAPPGPCGG